MQKTLIVIGIALVITGIAWPWLRGLRLGRLPGDFVFEGDNFTIYLPIMTMILVSVVVSFVLWLLR